MLNFITLWDEADRGSAAIETKKIQNKIDVNEICQYCGYSKTVHFDLENCPIDSHWQRCPNCGASIKLFDHNALWKIKCSCGKNLKPRRDRHKPPPTRNILKAPCPD